jgi:selenoprotein W-related protein
LPKAVSLTEKLLKLPQSIRSLKLIPSNGGVFEICINGRLIYSKKATGEHPDPNEVARMVREFR